MPEDFAQALKKSKTAAKAWEKLSYTHQKEYVNWTVEAKKEETRTRRIAKIIAELEK